MSASPPIATKLMQRRELSLCAKSRLMQRSKKQRYSITSSAACYRLIDDDHPTVRGTPMDGT
jgi:hypothetical protein